MMKRFYTFLAGCSLAVAAMAQNFITLHGTSFLVDLNNRTMTATIVDYDHKIDDAKYPMEDRARKLKNLNGNDNVLLIPEKVTVKNRTYTVTAIGRAAFADYRNFEYVNIPSTVKNIGEYAFFNTNVVDVTVPESVVAIGDRAFGRCFKLKRLTIPTGVTLGNRVYAEVAKKITIRRVDEFSDFAEMADEPVESEESVAVAGQKPKYNPGWVTSDIDLGIPNATESADNTFAVIIANEVYESDPNVDFAVQDGRTFRTYCEQVLGIPSANINYKENATFNHMRQSINWMKDVAKAYKGNARFLVYYAGHGSQGENEHAGLLPVDGMAIDEESGYSLSKLYSTISEMETEYVCVFLDACFSGKKRDDSLVVPGGRGARRAVMEKPKGNMVVFAAAQDKETALAYSEKGHGVFTYFLLKKLKETKGEVSLGELSDYIQESVSKVTSLVLNGKQTPNTDASSSLANSWRKITLLK